MCLGCGYGCVVCYCVVGIVVVVLVWGFVWGMIVVVGRSVDV